MKKKQLIMILIFVMAITIIACGKEQESSEQTGTALPSEQTATTLPSEQTDTPLPSEQKATALPSEQTDTPLPSEQKDTALPSEMKDKPLPSEQPDAQLPSVQPKEQSASAVTLYGTITQVGQGEFVIRKADVIDSDVMVDLKDDAQKVSVKYDENTEFILCTSSDRGISTDYSRVTFEDLSSEKSVEIEGAFEGDCFMAWKVTIYNFI